jgi:3-dehydroquinate dehydratase
METPEDQGEEEPLTVINISLREQIRKERFVAVVFAVILCGLGYLIYLNIH